MASGFSRGMRAIIRGLEQRELRRTMPVESPAIREGVAFVFALGEQARNGQTVSRAALERGAEVREGLLEAIQDADETADIDEFSPSNRKLLFDVIVRLAFVGEQGAFDRLRYSPLPAWVHHLYAPTLDGADGWDAFAAVLPALVAGRPKLAARALRRLHGRRAEVARRWLSEAAERDPSQQTAVDRIFTLAEAERPGPAPVAALHPAQRWALLAQQEPSPSLDRRQALEAEMGHGPARTRLAAWWDIEAPEDAERVLGWLLQEGHRGAIVEGLEAIERGASLEGESAAHLAAAKMQYRGKDTVAWDACRAITVAREAAAAGYLSSERGWAWALEAGRLLRSRYESWEELDEGYLLGEAWFRAGWGSSAELRRQQARLQDARASTPFDLAPEAFELDEAARARPETAAPPPPPEEPPAKSDRPQHLAWAFIAAVMAGLAALAAYGHGPLPSIYDWERVHLRFDGPVLSILVAFGAPALIAQLALWLFTGRRLQDPKTLVPKWMARSGSGAVLILVGGGLALFGLPKTEAVMIGVGLGMVACGLGIFAWHWRRARA